MEEQMKSWKPIHRGRPFYSDVDRNYVIIPTSCPFSTLLMHKSENDAKNTSRSLSPLKEEIKMNDDLRLSYQPEADRFAVTTPQDQMTQWVDRRPEVAFLVAQAMSKPMDYVPASVAFKLGRHNSQMNIPKFSDILIYAQSRKTVCGQFMLQEFFCRTQQAKIWGIQMKTGVDKWETVLHS